MTFMKSYLWYYKSKHLDSQDFATFYSILFVKVLILTIVKLHPNQYKN